MNTFSRVPPGFRFHPTDEELVDYYLRKKITSRRIDLDVIKDVDLYKIEPWDLQDLCRIGTEDQNEWYFFSHKDKKYPTGTRTNRATAAGFWKATGRDKAIYSKHDLIGMRKTLVFYKGRAPNGQKSDWIMHEYRLETDENGAPQEEGWVVCRVFKKRMTTVRKMSEHGSPCWYDDQSSFMPDLDSPKQISHPNFAYHHVPYACKKELDFQYQVPQEHFLQLPLLEIPKMLNSSVAPLVGLHMNHAISTMQSSPSITEEEHIQKTNNSSAQLVDQLTDWRVLDKFVASQLSHEDAPEKHNYSNENHMFAPNIDMNVVVRKMDKQEAEVMMPENNTSSMPASHSPIELWK